MTTHSYGDQFRAALACKTKQEADDWLAKEIQYYEDEYNKAADEARSTIMNNLGYMAGYYDHETAVKIEKLFGALHPIFGSATYHKDITPEQAFNAGKKWAGQETGR